MTDNTRNFLVGVASAVALLGLAWLLLSFGELDPLFHPRYRVVINTDNAAGLRAGSQIVYNGVPVGQVTEVTAQENPAAPVRIVASIDENVRLPANVRPAVTTSLIGGSAVLQLRVPEGGPVGQLSQDGRAEITAPMGGGMFADLTEQLDRRMEPLIESLERFNKLSDTFVSLGENLNNMLLPQTSSDLATGEPPNLNTAVARLNAVLAQAEEGLNLANSFLGDEQLLADAKQSVHKATQLIDQATTAVDHYTKLAGSLQTNADEFTRRTLPVMDALGATLEEVRRVAKLASEGQGTAGQLLNNPDLYNSLNDAAVRLNRTLTDLQVLIQLLRAEGFIIQF